MAWSGHQREDKNTLSVQGCESLIGEAFASRCCCPSSALVSSGCLNDKHLAMTRRTEQMGGPHGLPAMGTQCETG